MYDGTQIALEFDGSTAADLSHRYLWGRAVDEILADEQVSNLNTPGDVLWPLTDNQGTVRDLATYDSQNDVTTIANHRTYNAYGQMTSETNSAADHLFAYTGRPLDEATDLQNNLNRWYDARVGRWLSEDPIGFDGLDANLYRYCDNGPLAHADATGLADGSKFATYQPAPHPQFPNELEPAAYTSISISGDTLTVTIEEGPGFGRGHFEDVMRGTTVMDRDSAQIAVLFLTDDGKPISGGRRSNAVLERNRKQAARWEIDEDNKNPHHHFTIPPDAGMVKVVVVYTDVLWQNTRERDAIAKPNSFGDLPGIMGSWFARRHRLPIGPECHPALSLWKITPIPSDVTPSIGLKPLDSNRRFTDDEMKAQLDAVREVLKNMGFGLTDQFRNPERRGDTGYDMYEYDW